MTPRARVASRIRGLYGIADADTADPERTAAHLLAGGCRLVQLRAKSWEKPEIERVARLLVTRCRDAGATFIVNDHADIAAAVDADGVHVGQLDAPTPAVRAVLGPDRILGRSTHSLDQVRNAAQGADYVAFGPIWPTTRGGRPKGVRGVDALRQARAAVPGVPLVAIGGIDAARLPEVIAAGADAWAVIGAVALAADPVAATRALITGSR